MLFPNPANLLMWKHYSNNYWTEKRICFSFPIPIPLLVVLQASYYTCNIKTWNYDFQTVEKSKFVLWQSGYYNLLKKKINWKFFVILNWKKGWENSLFWSFHFFENVPLLSISRNSLQTPSLRYVLKSLLNLDCKDSIRFGIFQVA